MKSLKLIGLLFIVLLASCRNDIDETSTVIELPEPPVIQQFEPEVLEVVASVTGFVADEDDQPMANAAVSYAGGSTTTDDYGHFFIRDQKLNARGTVVQVSKEGYFDGNRRFFPTNGKMSRIKITLLKKNFDQSFQASSGGTLAFEENGQVVFGANSIRQADGTAFNGEVWAAIKWMDPTALSTMDRMPGNLQGVSLLNQEMALSTYGMLAVELEDAQGNALNLLEGQTAEIRMPVPASILSNAPATIPLWSFYPNYGLWAEESEARLENGFYVGNVSHFSFWNCDYPFELVNFTARLLDTDGDAIENMLVVLELANTSSGVDYSSADGIVSGKVPANEQLTMKVFDQCGEILFEQVIGPFASDINLGDVTIPNTGINNTSISGELVDCNNNPIPNGLLIIKFGDKTIYRYLSTSTFDVSFTTCQSTTEVELIGVDMDALIQSDAVIVPTGTNTNIGQLSVCDIQLDNYIQITVGDTTFLLPLDFVGQDTLNQGPGTMIRALYQQDYWVSMTFGGITAGDYSTMNVVDWLFFFDAGILITGGSFDTFIVTQFDGTWDVVKGNFSGTLRWQDPSQGHVVDIAVSGSFSWTE